MSFLSAVGGALSSIIPGAASGGLNLLGAKKQFKYSERAARNDRAWKERMSNTALQRMRVDAAAAGLNPLLFAGSGASTPSAAAARAPDLSNIGTSSVSTALQARMNRQQLRNMQATEGLTRAQTSKAMIDAGVSQATMQDKLQSTITGRTVAEKNRLQASLLKPAARILHNVDELVVKDVVHLLTWAKNELIREGQRWDLPSPQKLSKMSPSNIIRVLEDLFDEHGDKVSPALHWFVQKHVPRATKPLNAQPPFRTTKERDKWPDQR